MAQPMASAYTSITCSSARTNHPSANEHPDVISNALHQEAAKGRLVGPLTPHLYPYVHISSLGAVPKKHTTNKWRLILDLSHPAGTSVNDGIDRKLCSLSYMKVNDVVQHVLNLGNGCLIAKLDIESAFQNIPVHPHDRHLLGMLWKNQFFVETVLPIGLHSAPKIFNCIAVALQWIVKQHGASYLEHFLDNFITADKREGDECTNNLSILTSTCSILGLPMAFSGAKTQNWNNFLIL